MLYGSLTLTITGGKRMKGNVVGMYFYLLDERYSTKKQLMAKSDTQLRILRYM